MLSRWKKKNSVQCRFSICIFFCSRNWLSIFFFALCTILSCRWLRYRCLKLKASANYFGSWSALIFGKFAHIFEFDAKSTPKITFLPWIIICGGTNESQRIESSLWRWCCCCCHMNGKKETWPRLTQTVCFLPNVTIYEPTAKTSSKMNRNKMKQRTWMAHIRFDCDRNTAFGNLFAILIVFNCKWSTTYSVTRISGWNLITIYNRCNIFFSRFA